ncbi:hypothetical protein [Paracoccus beibuensis]|uniref:hypothetical protein n=1 Tax=Paracoccus beibuensis TaxID=547602 RepID=UPI002AD25D5B|nr:hypothetical protein [Paracoccus beibuensis]
MFEANRRIILGAGMIGVAGRVQREGEVVHHVVHRIADFSAKLASVGSRGGAFPLPNGDEFRSSPSSVVPPAAPDGPRPREIYIPDLYIDSVKVKAKNFR